MADTKTTGLTENTAPISTDLMYMVDDPGGSAASQKVTMATLQSLLAVGILPGGRLTLTTATPVTTADVTGATTVYYTPFLHDRIGLYDGTSWRSVSFTEKSLTMVGATASKPYDFFGYLNGGTLALEKLIWTDATTRATALAYQDGRLVKSGDATRRYLGTVYSNSSGGQTDDSITKRCVWNYYNRVPRRFYRADATNHTYTTATYRLWNNDAAQKLEYICGVVEEVMDLRFHYVLIYSDSAGRYALLQMDEDGTTGDTTNYPSSTVPDPIYRTSSATNPMPTLGYHVLNVLEYCSTPTATFSEYKLTGYIMG